jgi:hypothetical protein
MSSIQPNEQCCVFDLGKDQVDFDTKFTCDSTFPTKTIFNYNLWHENYDQYFFKGTSKVSLDPNFTIVVLS